MIHTVMRSEESRRWPSLCGLVLFLDLLAGFYLSTSTIAYGQTTTSYISRQYKFVSSTPPVQAERFADGFFGLVGGQKVNVRSSVEDDTLGYS